MLSKPKKSDLFVRVVQILDQARGDVVRAVNNHMVVAYWLIGREIVQAIQGGKGRAQYGDQIIETLSQKLTQKYGRGFSTTNLRYFRTFYIVYKQRSPKIRQIQSGESNPNPIRQIQSGELNKLLVGPASKNRIYGFSPFLGWSHYQALMSIENSNERLFYELEAEKEHWDGQHLERQIHTFLFARLLKSKNKMGVMQLVKEGNTVRTPQDTIKTPYILDFLGLPDTNLLQESDIESAIVKNLQSFLLELGKGFAFVKRQYRVDTERSHFYIDLVFYNYVLKCFVLIDLKLGKLTHQDVGQMDMYVRMFDDLERKAGDNPTVGLILCAEKDEIVAKYSVLKENKQIFASKYMLYLPSEKTLQNELRSEKNLITSQWRALPARTSKLPKKSRKPSRKRL